MMKQKIKNYFYYHHYNTIPVKESHAKFMTALNKLEAFVDEDFDSYFTVDEIWKAMLKAINSLSDEQIESLYHTIIRRYE